MKKLMCRIDTWHGRETPGGSVWTTAHNYGRREAVEECGEQLREPRGKRARQKESQGEKWEQGNMGRKESNTPNSNNGSSGSSDSALAVTKEANTGVLKLREAVTEDELLLPVINVAISFSVILVPVFFADQDTISAVQA